jgi:hypothetical protein
MIIIITINITILHYSVKDTDIMPSSGMLCRLALVRTDVLEERSAYIIRVARIGELGTTLAITGIPLQRAPVASYS